LFPEHDNDTTILQNFGPGEGKKLALYGGERCERFPRNDVGFVNTKFLQKCRKCGDAFLKVAKIRKSFKV